MAARPFSDELMEAAARVRELPADEIARLLMKAAIRLRIIKDAGPNLEHIPVSAYQLLRRLSREAVPVSSLHGRDDQASLAFLTSRQLVETAADGVTLTVTPAGSELGEIAAEVQQ